jgi:hypothetical protein
MKIFRVEMHMEIVVAAENSVEALKDAPDLAHEALHEIEVIGVTEIKKRADLPEGYRKGAWAYTTHPKDIEIDMFLED